MRHETLNEIGAETAILAFADWCDARFAAVREEKTAT